MGLILSLHFNKCEFQQHEKSIYPTSTRPILPKYYIRGKGSEKVRYDECHLVEEKK